MKTGYDIQLPAVECGRPNLVYVRTLPATAGKCEIGFEAVWNAYSLEISVSYQQL
jgi:hypothetical protein